jgi:hypothetical protein
MVKKYLEISNEFNYIYYRNVILIDLNCLLTIEWKRYPFFIKSLINKTNSRLLEYELKNLSLLEQLHFFFSFEKNYLLLKLLNVNFRKKKTFLRENITIFFSCFENPFNQNKKKIGIIGFSYLVL